MENIWKTHCWVCSNMGHHHHSHFEIRWWSRKLLGYPIFRQTRYVEGSYWALRQLNSWLRGHLSCSFSGSLMRILDQHNPPFFWAARNLKAPGLGWNRIRWSPSFKVSPSKDVDHLAPSGSSDSWNNGRTWIGGRGRSPCRDFGWWISEMPDVFSGLLCINIFEYVYIYIYIF